MRRGLGLAALRGCAAPRPVPRIFWRDSAVTAWGGDQLRRQVLASGRRAAFRVATPGPCDVRIRFSEGRAIHAG